MSKKLHRQRKAAVAFELNPPRCINCQNYEPPMHAVPGKTTYLPPRCGALSFAVKPSSICDIWTGRDGETIE